MSDPVQVILAIGGDAAALDLLEKALGDAQDAMDVAEECWLEVYDQVAEDLKDEMVSEGRRGDPAEHWVTTVARRHNRLAYTNWRRARRALEILQLRVQAKRSAMNGRQSQLAALRDEARAPVAQSKWERRVA